MKTLSRTHASRSMLSSRSTSVAVALLGATAMALWSGCALRAEGDHGTSAAEPVAQSTEALMADGGKPPCAGTPRPKATVCMTYECEDPEWMAEADARGTACTTAKGTAGACSGKLPAQCDEKFVGQMTAKYVVLSVEYAPPGGASNVDYATGSTWGSSTSVSNAFQKSTELTVSNKSSLLGFASGGVSVTASASVEDTDKTAIDLKSTTQTDLNIDGFGDGVDHGLDRIYLWLGPEILFDGYGNTAGWTLGQPAPGTAHVVYVTPEWLLNGTTRVDVQQELDLAGITPDDYAQILAVDPYAASTPAHVDPLRYTFETELPYEPVTVDGQKPTTSKFAITGSSTTTTSSEAKTQYKVGVTLSGSASFLGFASVGLKDTSTLQWTHDNLSSVSNGDTISATATITQPGFDYTGPIYLDVYKDTIFNTFLFVLNGPAARTRLPQLPGAPEEPGH